jgi:hypothetical protein
MTMQIKAGDYLVLNVVLGKRVLAKCTAVSAEGKRYKARIESIKQSDDEEPPIEFKAKEVVANLGHSPTAGSVYGIKVEPVRERLDHPFWGQISVHHPLNDDHRKTLKKVMHEVSTKLKTMHMPALKLETQIRTQTAKMAGFYRYYPKAENDVLCVKIDEDMSDLEYKFSHEFAHGIWFRSFTPKMKMAWVNLFHTAVEISSYSDKDLSTLLEDIKTNGDIRSFAKENPDDLPVLKAIFRYIKQTHAMDRSHFEMALMLGEDVDQYWPTSLELGDKQTLLTKYAMKSPEELFAEAFSLKFIGKKLPKTVDGLLDQCMRRLLK